jgi:hypothetical protein
MSQYILRNVPAQEILELIEKLSEVRVFDNARLGHDDIEQFLNNEGFKCIREYPVKDRGDGSPGKIDLYATKETINIGIEIDNWIARGKSVYKLNSLDDDVHKIIILRNYYKELELFEGIDTVISLNRKTK